VRAAALRAAAVNALSTMANPLGIRMYTSTDGSDVALINPSRAGVLRILLIGDVAFYRQYFEPRLATAPGLVIVAHEAEVERSLDACIAHQPHAIVLDWDLPGGTGVAILHLIRRQFPERSLLIIALSRHAHFSSCSLALSAGANHLLDKSLDLSVAVDILSATRTRLLQPLIYEADTVPSVEMKRLLALLKYQILDTPADQRFDDITALAAQICDTPMAAISVIDNDRQWFKSRLGIEIESAPRECSICQYALEQDGVLMVEDVRADHRFSSNSIVVGEHPVIFYAGAPLIVDDGERVGTLCVLDSKPRVLNSAQQAALSRLSRQVVSLFELRRLTQELHEVNERRTNVEQELEYLSTRDPLTGLVNRVMFRANFDHAITYARRHQQQLACLYVDIDNFKAINDSLGHAVGDAVLIEATHRFQTVLRESDLICRLGGDEFVLMLPDVVSAADVTRVAAKLIEQFTREFTVGGHAIHATCSIGISLYPGDANEADVLMRYADIALYHAKEAGKASFRFFAEEMNARVIERLTLEHELHAGLIRGEFVLHYQPLVDLETGELTGAEALLRWHRRFESLVSPAAFLPLAEEIGVIRDLGDWVVATACADAADWRDRGLGLRRLSINVSAGQLVDQFVEVIALHLREKMLPAEFLEIEITETQILKDLPTATRVLTALRRLGVRVAVDDFGTGYSSLSVLKQLPVDRLKIDCSFVKGVADSREDTAIVRSIIEMAHHIELRVLAEGVATQAQLLTLRALRCDEFQGFYVSPALNAVEFERFHREWDADLVDGRHKLMFD
jgi:diguanylate cyclase